MKVQLKNILCTTDFSDCSRHTVPYGVALAKEFGAKIFLCHVVSIPPVITHGEVIGDPDWDREKVIQNVREELELLMRDQSMDWEPVITVGHVADEISHIAEEKGIDLVISATHGRSGLKRVILGSVTERLMRTLHCPLLIVRSSGNEPPAPSHDETKPYRILVGCDLSPDSELAFLHGLSLAQQFQSEIHLVHVIEPSAYRDLLKSSVESREPTDADLREQIGGKLARMVPDDALNWCSVKTNLLAGQPYEELTKYAVVNNIDLVVLGFRGRGLMETLLLGSTTARVIRQAPCPVLAVQPVAL